MVGKPLWWALEQLNLVEADGPIESESTLWRKIKGRYVILSNLEKAADTVVERQRQKGAVSPSDVLYTFDSFRKEFCNPGTEERLPLSDQDLKVLIRFLERDKGVIVSDKEVSSK